MSAIRPGDKVLVPMFGRFGHLLCEIARRCRAEVHTIEVPWGEVFTPDQVEDAIKRIRPRLLLTVQGIPPPPCCSRWPSSARFAAVMTCCLHRRHRVAGERAGNRCWGLDAVPLACRNALAVRPARHRSP